VHCVSVESGNGPRGESCTVRKGGEGGFATLYRRVVVESGNVCPPRRWLPRKSLGGLGRCMVLAKTRLAPGWDGSLVPRNGSACSHIWGSEGPVSASPPPRPLPRSSINLPGTWGRSRRGPPRDRSGARGTRQKDDGIDAPKSHRVTAILSPPSGRRGRQEQEWLSSLHVVCQIYFPLTLMPLLAQPDS